MGAVVGAGLAAGRTSAEMLEAARRMSVYRLVRRRARLALFDPRPLVARLSDELGDPRIEDLSVPLGITAFDLVTGRPSLLTSGRLADALQASIAVPLFFPPTPDADGVWSDAGPWEGIPVSLARSWAPDEPVVGVFVDVPKPGFLAGPVGASAAAGGLAPARRRTRQAKPLTARRYLGLLDRALGRSGREGAAGPPHRAAPRADERAPVRPRRPRRRRSASATRGWRSLPSASPKRKESADR